MERTTRPDTERFIMHLVAPNGWGHYENNGAIIPTLPVTVRMEYRRIDGAGGDWQLYLDSVWAYATAQTVRFSFYGPVLPRGQYTVRITRLTPDYAFPPVMDELYWAGMRSERFQDPVQMGGLCKVAVRIKATEQLSGTIDQLNAIVGSYLLAYVGGAWGYHQTANPAWIYLDILMGTANARPVPVDLIDVQALMDWAVVCDAQQWTYSAVHDFRATVAEMLHDVAAAGRATPHKRGALYSILRESTQTVPVQHFTPRNSWGFSGSKVFQALPHGLKIRFINPDKDWQQDELLCFDDGYDESTATIYEVFELFGVADAKQAWRHGRYFLAAAKLRPERFTLNLDIEHLVATRGDLVRVTHDVPLWGDGAARIHAIISPTRIELDEVMPFEQDGVWRVIRIRTSDGGSVGPITIAFVTPTPTKPVTDLLLETPLPGHVAVGDLVLVGEHGKESVDCLVQAIECHPGLHRHAHAGGGGAGHPSSRHGADPPVR